VQIHELKTGVEKPISANTARLTNVYQYPCDSAVKYIGIKIIAITDLLQYDENLG
jgi:hypothetical protein